MYPGGFHGWAQTLADGLKFLYKEDIIPAAADRKVFSLAPAAIMVPVIMIYLVIPIDQNLIVEDLDVGIFYLLAISSVSVIGVLMAGWSSANKYALIGALRSAAQLIADERPHRHDREDDEDLDDQDLPVREVDLGHQRSTSPRTKKNDPRMAIMSATYVFLRT